MKEKIEALIHNYKAHIERLKESISYMAAKGFYETATKYQADINIYRSVITDLNEILAIVPKQKHSEIVNDALYPKPTLLTKLGSIAVHAEEMISASGHPIDKVALQTVLRDPEVVTWLVKMDLMALLPVKRETKK